MFPPLPYLEWIDGRPSAARHDLTSSDLRRDQPNSVSDAVPPRLADLPVSDDGTPLVEFVAAEYDVDPSSVVLAAGATHANFLAAATAHALAVERGNAADPTPRALVEVPGYGPLVETPRALGMRADRFRRPLPEASIDRARVEAAIHEPALERQFTHLTITNRHNPTGALTTRRELKRLAKVTRENEGYLIVDEVYAPYVAEADGDAGFGGPTGAGLRGVVSVGSLTKFHGLSGLRVGWLIAPERFARRAEQVRHHVPALAGPSVALARRFFANRDELVAEARDHCAANHELLADFADARSDLIGPVAEGCPFAFLSHESADGDAVAEAAWEDDVLVVPGRFFGERDWFRVALGNGPDDSAEALDALGSVLDGL
ncbi:pyridoxal phosphate-dependent aminotransferase [Halorarum halophilum]|uniref:Aminotransferase n=1 Tax=Halorarum halophilum TaxID=2743090 RepID=A0A7D5GWG5_9EURY|nr:pyridoxal phosphate-dependent aminotransferase [Halobaculum halophilum]QLG26889.1 pyridoxal phosphate-dependent aminotransferase [Halobaculum halophilum]